MGPVIAVDQKGQVYLVPAAVLAKHCKQIGTMAQKKKGKGKGDVQGQDWFVCQWKIWYDCGV